MSKNMQPHRKNWFSELAFLNSVKTESEASEEKKEESCYENVYYDLDEESVNRTGKTRKRTVKEEYEEKENQEKDYQNVYYDLDEEFLNRTGKSIRTGHEYHMPHSPHAYGTETKSESGRRVPLPNNLYDNETESRGVHPHNERVPPPNDNPYDIENTESEGFHPRNETESEELPTTPDYPYFVTRMRKARKDALHIPYDMIKDYNLQLPEKAIIRDTRGHEWKTELTQWNDGRMWYTGGLSSFWRVNQIKDDDFCICKFMEDEVKGLVLLINKIDS